MPECVSVSALPVLVVCVCFVYEVVLCCAGMSACIHVAPNDCLKFTCTLPRRLWIFQIASEVTIWTNWMIHTCIHIHMCFWKHEVFRLSNPEEVHRLSIDKPVQTPLLLKQ